MRKIVLPLVGFWEISGKLDEVRGRIVGIEAAVDAVLASLTDIQQQIKQLDAEVKAASISSDEKSARSESDLVERFDKLIGTLASETDRLDSYIAYRADTLRESIVTLSDSIDRTDKPN